MDSTKETTIDDLDIIKTDTALYHFFRVINLLPDYLTGISVGLTILTILIQIVGRWIGSPAPWTEEATRFLFLWMVFLGIGIGFRRTESARVTILVNNLSPSIQNVFSWVYVVATIGFFLFMLVTGVQLVGQQIRMHEMGSALMIPLWLIGLCVPFSAMVGITGVIESTLFYPETIGFRRAES